jgi:hypothetical protein
MTRDTTVRKEKGLIYVNSERFLFEREHSPSSLLDRLHFTIVFS